MAASKFVLRGRRGNSEYVLLRPLQTSLFARDIDDSRAYSVYATSSGHREGPFPVSPVLRVAQETPESPHQEA